MNSRKSLAPLVALLAVAVVVAAPQEDVAAKKKASYCAAKAKKLKAKSAAKAASAKFFVYTNKRNNEYIWCSESPKTSGVIAASEGIQTTSHLRAVKGNCAIWRLTMKPGVPFDAGSTWLKIVPYTALRKGAKFSIQRRLAPKTDTINFEGIALSKNCVFAAAYTVNGAAKLAIDGVGKSASFDSFTTLDVTGASPAELRAVKVLSLGGSSARITWSQGGVAKSHDFAPKP